MSAAPDLSTWLARLEERTCATPGCGGRFRVASHSQHRTCSQHCGAPGYVPYLPDVDCLQPQKRRGRPPGAKHITKRVETRCE